MIKYIPFMKTYIVYVMHDSIPVSLNFHSVGRTGLSLKPTPSPCHSTYFTRICYSTHSTCISLEASISPGLVIRFFFNFSSFMHSMHARTHCAFYCACVQRHVSRVQRKECVMHASNYLTCYFHLGHKPQSTQCLFSIGTRKRRKEGNQEIRRGEGRKI